MKCVLLRVLLSSSFGILVFLAGPFGLPTAHAQVEGLEAPKFGPAEPPSTAPPTKPEPMVPPTTPEPAPAPGDRIVPAPAPEGRNATEPQPYVPPSSPSVDQIKLGQELMNQGKAELALQYFEEATKLATGELETADAYYVLGNALRSLNRFDEAIDAYSTTILNNPDDTEAYLRRGIAWFYKGEYQIAWDDFDDAALIVRDVDEPYPEFWKGLTRAKQGDWLGAVNSYAFAILKSPRFALAYTNRGLAYLQLDEPEKAVLDFDQAIRHDRRNPVHYYRRGIAQARLDHTDAALASYNEAIRLDPNYADAVRNRNLLQGSVKR
ncbi:MAG: tetratricopeptide repeat protein [Pirellulales bacterium]|nr:tetratricopeptide repeat protein [Pirellulales bacterium]